MQTNYVPFIARVIQNYEGGYGWDRNDPGGPTKYGITCYDLAEHRGVTLGNMAAWAPIVKAMPLSEAEDIYATKYAKNLYFDALKSGPDCCVCDYGISSGIGRPLLVARRLLQAPSSLPNPALIAAINAAHAADPKWFVDAMCQERLHFMHQIRGGAAWSEFGKGWGARVADLNAYSDHLATAAIGAPQPPVPWSPPAPPTVPHPKVTHGDPNLGTNTIVKTAGGAAVSGTAAHVSGPPHWLVPAVVGGVALAGIAYALYRSRMYALANRAIVIPPTVPPMPAAVAAAVLGASHVLQAA